MRFFCQFNPDADNLEVVTDDAGMIASIRSKLYPGVKPYPVTVRTNYFGENSTAYVMPLTSIEMTALVLMVAKDEGGHSDD